MNEITPLQEILYLISWKPADGSSSPDLPPVFLGRKELFVYHFWIKEL